MTNTPGRTALLPLFNMRSPIAFKLVGLGWSPMKAVQFSHYNAFLLHYNLGVFIIHDSTNGVANNWGAP